jgi:ABC-type phosphate transport system auxiliary subunit
MSRTMTFTETLTVTSCWCGIHFAIPSNLYKWMQRDSDNSCRCPMGHTMVFSDTQKEELERARAALADATRRAAATRDLLAAEERSHSATRGHLTRVKKRVHHGVCPHCQRSFQDLRRHMRSKHKDEIKADE